MRIDPRRVFDSERVLERRPPWRSSRGYVTPHRCPSTAPRQRIQQRTRHLLRFCHPSLTSTAPSQTPCIQQQKRQRMEQMKKLGIGKFENQVGTPSRNPHAPSASTHSCGHPRIFPEISHSPSSSLPRPHTQEDQDDDDAPGTGPAHHDTGAGITNDAWCPPDGWIEAPPQGAIVRDVFVPSKAPLSDTWHADGRVPSAPTIRPTRSARHGQTGIRRPVRGTRHRPHEQQQVLRPGGVRREGSIVREDW